MQPAIRQYYNLEEIWGGSQTKPRKTVVRKTPAGKTPAGKTASRTAK